MKSIAIWYIPVNNSKINLKEIELHFNFWKIPDGTGVARKFLDIGLKLENTENVESLNIYFPASVTADGFEDIVNKFIDKPALVSAIFNEDYKVITEATSKAYEIKDKDGNQVFFIYKTSANDLSFTKNFKGTIVSIKVPRQSTTTYYRFRVKGDYIKSLSTVARPTNAILESAFSEVEMIDFRVNEIRDLDLDLLERMRSEVLLTIKKEHFFFICSNEEEVIGNHQPYINCRNLENYRWNTYVDLDDSKNSVFLAYHWSEKGKESVSNLIKTKYEKNNWRTISMFFFFGFLVAVLIELFSNWLYDCIK